MQFLRRVAFIGFLLCLFMFAASPSAAKNDKGENENWQQQVQDLNRKLDEQKKEAGELEDRITRQQEQINTLKDHISHVYKQTIRDTGVIEKYRLGNEAYLRSSYFDLVRDDDDDRIEDEYDNAFVNYLDLKFMAQPAEEVQFHATLTMYKLWGSWNDPEDVSIPDFQYSNEPSDSAIKVKRAYVDYRPLWLDRKVNLTFGRLPTSGGYLTKYRYNRPSMSTYPDLTFNAESDGAALTFYFNHSFAKSLNLIYARSEDDTDAYPFIGDAEGLEDIDFYTAQFNARIPFLDNSVCVLQWFRVDNLRPTGDNEFKESLNQLLLLRDKNPATVDFPDELGHVDKYTFQLSNDRIFDLPLDLFASVAYSETDPNDDQILINGIPLESEALSPEIITSLALDPENPKDLASIKKINNGIQSIGPYLGCEDNDDSEDAWAVYAGIRYHVPSEKLLNPKIGLEYFDGSEHWVGLNIASVDPYRKLNTRGSVWEVYWNQPLVEHMLQMRTGYQWIDRDYTESLLSGLYGTPEDADEDDRLFYISMEYTF
ncbi:MAG: DUF3373 family protein [Desulfobacterales bacterium]|nr:DUF3373 family protein [Desulfobacterales bacterium]